MEGKPSEKCIVEKISYGFRALKFIENDVNGLIDILPCINKDNEKHNYLTFPKVELV